MAKGKPSNLSAEQVEEIREAFALFDVDSSGAISYKDFEKQKKEKSLNSAAQLPNTA